MSNATSSKTESADLEIREAKRIEEETLITSKAHYNDAAAGRRWAVGLGVSAAVLAASAAGLSQFSFNYQPVAVLIVSLISAVITGFLTIHNPGGEAARHHAAGVRFQEIKDEARRIAYRASLSPISETRAQINHLSTRKTVLNDSFPPASHRGYLKAKEGIAQGEADYIVDSNTEDD